MNIRMGVQPPSGGKTKELMEVKDNSQNWHQQKTYESMITYGCNAIKFVLIANGGAIISILTFLGNHPDRISSITPALILFMLGVICGGAVNITAYFTQLSLFNQYPTNVLPLYDHKTWLWTSIALITIGILLFAIGGLVAVMALQ